MAAKLCSPGAQLLRASRLMSLPPPLPPAASVNIWSAPGTSSTRPASQAITTPTSSHARGDWGLKRNLPLKITQTYLKYHDLDTLEHRTTFESAHGDVMVLKRWQEMDLPITESTLSFNSIALRISAFNEIDDINTTTGQSEEIRPEADELTSARTNNGIPSSTRRSKQHTSKWRYQGPFLQTMNPKDLARYLVKKVRPRKLEFLRYAKRSQFIKDNYKLSSPPLREPTDAELDQIPLNIISLRTDPLVLSNLVVNFLDLPTNSAPPTTHPSAGLHYIRSDSYMANYPYIGPQLARGALPGRQLAGRGMNILAGIGGIVAKVTDTGTSSYSRDPVILRDNREITRWYKPMWAKVDAEGGILLEVQNAQAPPLEYIGPGAVTARPFIDDRMARDRATMYVMEQDKNWYQQWSRYQENQSRYQQQYPYQGYYHPQNQQQPYQETQYNSHVQQFQQPPQPDIQQQQQQHQYQQQLNHQQLHQQQLHQQQLHQEQLHRQELHQQQLSQQQSHSHQQQPHQQPPHPNQLIHQQNNQQHRQQQQQVKPPVQFPGRWTSLVRPPGQSPRNSNDYSYSSNAQYPQPPTNEQYPQGQFYNTNYDQNTQNYPQQQLQQPHPPNQTSPTSSHEQFTNTAEEVLHLLEETQAKDGSDGKGGNGREF